MHIAETIYLFLTFLPVFIVIYSFSNIHYSLSFTAIHLNKLFLIPEHLTQITSFLLSNINLFPISAGFPYQPVSRINLFAIGT
jgi:hypothetical protein